jgi:Arc/MetJ-type ribon-helix-helix transcriptional regulator
MMKNRSFSLPQRYYTGLDELVEEGVYPSVNEAVRTAVRELLTKHGRM